MTRLELSDSAALRAWLTDLRVALDDADAVTRDALRPLGRRELGRVLHRRNYRDARARILSLLDAADPQRSEGFRAPAGPPD